MKNDCFVRVFNPMTGKEERIPRKEHAFRWTGKMPCTGTYRCIFCGYEPQDKQRQIK